MADIHPTAIVDESAEIAGDVAIGAYTVIEPGVSVGEGTRVGRHNILGEGARIGPRNTIGDHNHVGARPYDKKHQGEPTTIEIGEGNTVHSFCTLCVGTAQGGGVTRLGDRNWLMAYVHVAHDCQVGSDCVLANLAQLAGHVTVGDHALLGGGALVHQHCRVGTRAMLSAGAYITMDLPPFFIAAGADGRRMSINEVGLERAGFAASDMRAVRDAYAALYRQGNSLRDAVAWLEHRMGTDAALEPLHSFLAVTGRGILRPGGKD